MLGGYLEGNLFREVPMLDRLPASHPGRSAPARTTAAWAMALHLGLIGALVAATHPSAPPPSESRGMHIDVIYQEPAASDPGLPRLPRPLGQPGPMALPHAPDLRLPVMPPGLPAPGTTAYRYPAGPGPSGELAQPGLSGGRGGGAPIVADLADQPPVWLSGPRPRYPDLLRAARIAGEVLVQAVIDSGGRVEAGSARVLRSSHPDLEPEALRVVRQSRYRPGRVAGRPVRVLIRQAVRFSLVAP